MSASFQHHKGTLISDPKEEGLGLTVKEIRFLWFWRASCDFTLAASTIEFDRVSFDTCEPTHAFVVRTCYGHFWPAEILDWTLVRPLCCTPLVRPIFGLAVLSSFRTNRFWVVPPCLVSGLFSYVANLSYQYFVVLLNVWLAARSIVDNHLSMDFDF